MRRFRWINRSLPQTLQIAVLFLYISAFFDLIRGFTNITTMLGILVLVGGLVAFAAAQGTVRERRSGWSLALVYAAWEVVRWVLELALGFSAWHIIGLILVVALFFLLLHPQSREYYRIWFR